MNQAETSQRLADQSAVSANSRSTAGLDRVTFFFPYDTKREIGGVSVIFSRMAVGLADLYGIKSDVVDYAGGYMAAAAAVSPGVGFVEFKLGKELRVGPDTILVMQSTPPYSIPPELNIHPDTRMVFWTAHPFNLVQTIVPLPWFKALQVHHPAMDRVAGWTFLRRLHRRLREFVLAMAAEKSILFMDGTTLRTTEQRLNLRIREPLIVPLPGDKAYAEPRPAHRDHNLPALRFGYLGRLCDFKIHVLLHGIRRLSGIAARRKFAVEFHVIGDGEDKDKLDGMNGEHEWFRIIKAGELRGAVRDEYLLNNVDVLMAMGMSALDGAKLGIPTILLDIAQGPISRNYKFKWLFESKDYSLGEVMAPEHFERNSDSLDQMVDRILHDYVVLANQSHRYYLENHAFPTICEKLVTALSGATFRYGAIAPAAKRKGIVRRSYEFIRDELLRSPPPGKA